MTVLNREELAGRKCKPCRGGMPPLAEEERSRLLQALPSWEIAADGKSISRTYVMKNFLAAVHLIGRIAEIAEGEDHHPDLHLTGYRRLKIDLSTHAIGGLSENDFILAAKIEAIPKELKS
jgi:4a-hydroxytetrahydrobiopterin dehydratase